MTQPAAKLQLPEDKGLELSWVVEALAPEPFTVLGHRLRPLSLGHLVLFRKAGLFWFEPEEISFALEDLALGVLLCKGTFQEGFELLDNPALKPSLFRWGRQLSADRWIDKLLRRVPWDLLKASQLFAEYVREGLKVPSHHWEEEGTFSVRMAEIQTVRIWLLKNTSLSDQEILNRPWRQSVMDYLTGKALEGQIEFTSENVYQTAWEMAKAEHERREKIRKEKEAKEEGSQNAYLKP